jgi:S-adenosylmethionine:diacylglycerol 3-amino-3-carboxypropyl transferase
MPRLTPIEYLRATESLVRELFDWHDRWERDRHLGPEVEEALRAEWEGLAQKGQRLMAQPVEGE